MSRVGKAEIEIPGSVKVAVNGQQVKVEGPKGKLSYTVHERIAVSLEGKTMVFKRSSELKTDKALHGTSRAVVANMIKGVSKGFSKDLEIVGVGYRGEQKGKSINLQLGYSHPILFNPPTGVDVVMSGPTKIVVSGYDKQKVGQTAANIREFRKPEPYKGKGIRYADENVRRKEVKKS